MRRGTSAPTWYEQGCALEATDPLGAQAAYERALAGRPDLADAHNNLGRLHHDGGRLALAETSYRLAICSASAAHGSSCALYWFNLGVSLEDQARRSEAIAAYERAISLDANLRDAHFNLARLLELAARRSGNDLLLRRAVRHLVRYRDLARIDARVR